MIVFIPHPAESAVPVDQLLSLLDAAHPELNVQASGGGFQVGCYDWTPIVALPASGPDVLTESREMADSLESEDPELLATVRRSDARWEISWDLRADPDPVPETADALQDVARVVTDAVRGVPLIDGSTLLRFDADASEQFFGD